MDEKDLARLVASYRTRFPSSTALEIESLIAAGLTAVEIEDELDARRRKYASPPKEPPA